MCRILLRIAIMFLLLSPFRMRFVGGGGACVRSFVRSLPSSLDSCLSIVCEDINILMTVYRGFIGDDNNNNNNTIM